MVSWIQVVYNGLVFGSIILLGAIGVSYLYGIVNVPNFAHGELMTIGAYVAYMASVTLGLPFLVAPVISALVTTAVGVALDRVLFRGRRNWTAVALLMLTLGASFVLRAAIRMVWGPDPLSYDLPLVRDVTVFDVTVGTAGLRLPLRLDVNLVELGIVLVGVTLATAMYLLLNYTKVGTTMRATADNRRLARIAGVDTERVFLVVWIISGALAAIAGIALGVKDGVIGPRMGFGVLLVVFTAVILGGVGDFYGAILGSYAVGIVHEAVVVVPFLKVSYGSALVFAVLIAGLLFKPEGITGGGGSSHG